MREKVRFLITEKELDSLLRARGAGPAVVEVHVVKSPVTEPLSESIFVKDQLVYKRLPLQSIRYLRSFRNYVELTATGGKYLIRTPLSGFLSQLPQSYFLRTHRSYAVNLALVDELGGNYLKLGDDEIPLSQTYREEVIGRIRLFG